MTTTTLSAPHSGNQFIAYGKLVVLINCQDESYHAYQLCQDESCHAYQLCQDEECLRVEQLGSVVLILIKLCTLEFS